MNNADKVLEVLGFQYKPLEVKFLEYCRKHNELELLEKYPALPSMTKISILDRFANMLGL